MKKSRTEKQRSAPEEEPAAERVPFRLIAGAWLVPGLGHWLLGRRKRALVFAFVVVSAFITGSLLDGELGTPKPQNPFSWLAAFACVGNGLLYIVRLVWINGLGQLAAGFPFGLQGGGNPSAAGFAFGNTFLYTAGLMNLLTVLDVSDIAKGRKD